MTTDQHNKIARILPPDAWDRIQERVQRESIPMAAMLGQLAHVERWAHDGALVVRMPKPFAAQLEKQTIKLEILNEAIVSVLGIDAFVCIEADGDDAGGKP